MLLGGNAHTSGGQRGRRQDEKAVCMDGLERGTRSCGSGSQVSESVLLQVGSRSLPVSDGAVEAGVALPLAASSAGADALRASVSAPESGGEIAVNRRMDGSCPAPHAIAGGALTCEARWICRP
jgi:hypothetical protein